MKFLDFRFKLNKIFFKKIFIATLTILFLFSSSNANANPLAFRLAGTLAGQIVKNPKIRQSAASFALATGLSVFLLKGGSDSQGGTGAGAGTGAVDFHPSCKIRGSSHTIAELGGFDTYARKVCASWGQNGDYKMIGSEKLPKAMTFRYACKINSTEYYNGGNFSVDCYQADTTNPNDTTNPSDFDMEQVQKLAEHITNQAAAGDPVAQDLVRQAQKAENPTMSDSELDDIIQQLQKSGTQTDTQTGTQDATNAKDLDLSETNSKLDKIDQSINQTNSKLDKLTGSISEILQWLKDWTKEDTNKEKTELDIEQQTTPNINTNIKFNAQCPNDVVISGTWQGQTISFTFFEWSKYCDFLIYLKYIIIAMASYGAVKIVGGVNVSD